jgi:hypothetical protein
MTRLLSAVAVLVATAVLAGCGGNSDDSAVTFVDTDTTPTVTTTVAPPITETTPTDTVTTEIPTTTAPETGGATPTTTTPPDTGGATIPKDTGQTGGTTVPRNGTSTSSTTNNGGATTQDPDCKAGTGPGHPDRPQCEPLSGPDARDDDGG